MNHWSLAKIPRRSSHAYDDGHDLGYSYDDIGNRTATVTNGRSATWASDAVNQYTSLEVPGALDIFGMADRYDEVTVNGVLASRQNEHFYRLLNVPNTASARYEEVTVETANVFGMPLESVTGY